MSKSISITVKYIPAGSNVASIRNKFNSIINWAQEKNLSICKISINEIHYDDSSIDISVHFLDSDDAVAFSLMYKD